jgi:hypothetical protein
MIWESNHPADVVSTVHATNYLSTSKYELDDRPTSDDIATIFEGYEIEWTQITIGA